MTHKEKKAYLLLKSIIFQYHGLDETERKNLRLSAEEIGGLKELQWVYDFIAQDYYTSFDRARNYLNDIISGFSAEKKTFYIDMVWKANREKGYITELEATAILKLAKDWKVEGQLMKLAKSL